MDIFFIKIQIIVNKQLFISEKWPFIVEKIIKGSIIN